MQRMARRVSTETERIETMIYFEKLNTIIPSEIVQLHIKTNEMLDEETIIHATIEYITLLKGLLKSP